MSGSTVKKNESQGSSVDQLSRDNIERMHENMKMLIHEIAGLRQRVEKAEANVEILRAENQNTKQLIGHLSGRGMGGTTVAH